MPSNTPNDTLLLGRWPRNYVSNNASSRQNSSHFKSSENMHDENIRLKKILASQKNDYEALKAKARRFEEDNVRKSRLIEELTDKKISDGSITLLADGGGASSRVVLARLRHKILKLEKQCSDKEKELAIIRSDIKMTDCVEMRTAMEIYFDEVGRLREVISKIHATPEKFKSDLESSQLKVETLRAKILQLVAENNALAEDNAMLRKDLDRAIDDGVDFERSLTASEEDEYGAMSHVGLVNHIRYMKANETKKARESDKKHCEEVDRLKSIILNVGEENVTIAEDNAKFKECCERLERNLSTQESKIRSLKDEIDQLRSNQTVEKTLPASYKENGRVQCGSMSDVHDRDETVPMQGRDDMNDDEEKKGNDVMMLQSALRGHLSRVNDKIDPVDCSSVYHLSRNADTVQMQSALRGHISRIEHQPEIERINASQKSLKLNLEGPKISLKDEDAVYLQSVMRGHFERSSC